jgi:colicin import membrane protein
MVGFAREHLRPLMGSAALHLALLALLAGAALNWRSKQESVPLAIEGTVVQYKDLPPALRSGRNTAEPSSAPNPAPRPEPKAEPARPPTPQPKAAARPNADEAAALERTQAAEEKQAAQRAAAAEKRQADAAAAKAKATQDATRKAAEAEARERAQAEAQQDKAAKARAAQDAKAKAAHEAELKRALAAEEESAAIAQSGVVDEYRALLVQTIERNWMRPPSARAGLECTLDVTQATGGTVVDVKVGDCNGDQAVRESITNAVYRSSPLPAPRDPRAFQRRLVIVFKPTE